MSLSRSVYVLVQFMPYGGDTLMGVYSTYEQAESASERFGRPTDGDERHIFEVEVDQAARLRFDPEDDG
jgi:hypothetical protein